MENTENKDKKMADQNAKPAEVKPVQAGDIVGTVS